ncbi:MAG: hypothetical protein J7K17_05405, partial [Candidatus Omnitrophica bacterium]|nr:hypothetical protein [Candidatus Omnitrophota bacterium]
SSDSDGDGLSDSVENAGWYIWVCTSGTTWHHIKVYSNPHYKDTDNDGVNDKVEYDHGTNPQDSDTDDDGLTDKQEIHYYGTYGYTWDSDEDELSDKQEIDDGTNPMEYTYRWLVMLYLDGDNNLYSEISAEKEDMLSHYSQLTHPVKVTMLFDGNSNGDTVYYQITKNGCTSINMGEEDMGNPNTLKGFIKRSHSFYPDAERIILVLSNHGAASLGVCEDDSSNEDMLSMNELQDSLSYAKSLFNKKLDVLYFQACLMQQIEVGYVIKDYVQNIIGSQWLMGGSSFSTFPWRIVINKISKSPESSVNAVAKAIAEGDIANSDDYIIAVQNTGYLGDIANLINEISNILITNITQVKNEIMKVINNPWFYNGHAEGYPYRDLKHFFEWLKENLTISGYEDPTLERCISSLMNDFARSVYTVFSSDERAHLWFQGVGIFLPVNSQENQEDFITDFERYGAPRWFDLTQLLLEG